ncbi:MAG TPA: ATP-binding protein [Nevskia sp.]|nr:ATP-binding protein [Nevskia sp.]
MFSFPDLSIRRKLLTLTALSTAVGLLLAAAALIGYAWFSARAGYERDLATVVHIVGDNSTAALLFNDRKAASETLAALRAKPEIRQACLYRPTPGGEVELFGAYAQGDASPCPQQAGTAGLIQDTDQLTEVAPVELKGEQVGTLRVTQTLQPLRATLLTQIVITLAILAVAFTVSFVIGWRMQRSISDPIVQLAETAQRVSATRDYTLRAAHSGRDEVGRLVDNFNQMLGQIALREREIRVARDELELQVQEKSRANAGLELALERLREAQAQLVQSEKMASLGALVAGVAHEINTPVGVGVTAASTLKTKAEEFDQRYQAGSMRRSDLERFVAMATEATRIILANLHRAADLIQSFKQVAVDQSSGERRRFGVKAYLDEVLVSLGPRLRKGGHEVSVECPDHVMVDSYPGALAQIVTNFVSNTLMHAYPDGAHGRIRIQVQQSGGHVDLTYRDDGCGITPENLPRVFDPFYTTKRGSGGSGLGMHIVYNLVTQLLGGRISLNSRPGEGVEINVRFPAAVASAHSEAVT